MTELQLETRELILQYLRPSRSNGDGWSRVCTIDAVREIDGVKTH